MKAVIIHRYGAAAELQLVDVPVPKPKATEVLVRNHATTVNPWDWMVRNGSMKLFTGNRFPKVLGTESAGIVEAVGREVQHVQPGDRVVAITGLQIGSYAEYVAVPASQIAMVPDAVSFHDAAALPVAASTAWNALVKLAKLAKGHQILINGASGAVGLFAVQIAKELGAIVTGVCSTSNVELVRSLGAHEVWDYTQTDITNHSRTFDVVLDAVSKLSFRSAQRMLTSNGVWIHTLPTPSALLTQLLTTFSNRKFKTINNKTTPATIELLADWIRLGKLRVVIDRTYTLAQLPEAHLYSETGRAKGKIIIQIK